MQEYISVLKKYAEFSGRASRREYWMFQLFNIIISVGVGFVLGIFSGITDSNVSGLSNLYTLAVFLPSLGLSIRRMHDTNHSGWFMLVPIYSFILSVTEGTKGPNKFGPDPWAPTAATGTPTQFDTKTPAQAATDGTFTPLAPTSVPADQNTQAPMPPQTPPQA